MFARNEIWLAARSTKRRNGRSTVLVLALFFTGCASSGTGVVGQWEGVYPSADVLQFAEDGTVLVAGTCQTGTYEQSSDATLTVHIDKHSTDYTVVREGTRLILIDDLGHTERFISGGTRARVALEEGCAKGDEDYDAVTMDAIRLAMAGFEEHFAERGTYSGYNPARAEDFDPEVRIRAEADTDEFKIKASHARSANEYYVIVQANSTEEAAIQLVPAGY